MYGSDSTFTIELILSLIVRVARISQTKLPILEPDGANITQIEV